MIIKFAAMPPSEKLILFNQTSLNKATSKFENLQLGNYIFGRLRPRCTGWSGIWTESCFSSGCGGFAYFCTCRQKYDLARLVKVAKELSDT